MNRNQWLTFAIGTSLLGSFFWTLTNGWSCSPLTMGELYTACIIKEQSYAIPAIFCTAFALILFICAWLELKKKNMEDDAPKHLKDIVKLSRLEHEVKELKGKLIKEVKNKN